mgnify:CR=1 FL=1
MAENKKRIIFGILFIILILFSLNAVMATNIGSSDLNCKDNYSIEEKTDNIHLINSNQELIKTDEKTILKESESASNSSQTNTTNTTNNSSQTNTTNSDQTKAKAKTTIKTSNLTAAYKSKSFTAQILDSNGSPISNLTILFTIKNHTYEKITDSNGKASLAINLNPGNYSIITQFKGNENYKSSKQTNSITIKRKKLALDTGNLVKKYGNSDSFKVILKNNGNPVSGVKIALTIGSHTYCKSTNSKGIVTLAINLKIGKYPIKSSIYKSSCYYSSTYSNNVTVKSQNPYNLTCLKWGSKGDITKNKALYKNLVKSSITSAIINTCKNGTPLIQFGNGSGKKVLILAGVHGHELSSQAACFKLINSIYNSKKKINGTVYIIPVLCPKTSAANIRYYNNVNLNSVADKSGTLSYKLVSYAQKLKVDALGDFHCTRPGGEPGKNIAMGTYKPQAESAKLAKYISKTTGYSYKIYNIAGEEYPGAVEDVCNIKGITSVTCEVITPHGTIKSGSISKSYNMMKALLKYYGIAI